MRERERERKRKRERERSTWSIKWGDLIKKMVPSSELNIIYCF